MAEYDSVIPAGSSGKLVAKMTTSIVQQGRVSKTIGVRTDSASSPNLQLRFSVEIHRPISAAPAFRFHLTTVEGTAVSERILLHRVDGQEFSVRRTKVDRTDLVATFEVATGKKNDTPKSPPGKSKTHRKSRRALGDRAPIARPQPRLPVMYGSSWPHKPRFRRESIAASSKRRPIIRMSPSSIFHTPCGFGRILKRDLRCYDSGPLRERLRMDAPPS